MVTEAPTPVGPPPAASGHILNFNEAPIDLVLKYLAESVGLQVVKQSPMADVRVTIIGQQPIYVEDTISLLNSALNIKGYAAIRSGANGRVLKIVTLEDAKKLNVPVHKGTQPDLIPTTDEVITQVMPLRYIDATRLRQDLTPLISPSASITSNAAGNSLVVTDTSANVHRIAEIVWALDVNTAGASEVRIYALKNADATSAVKLITDIFKPDTTTGGPGGFFRGMARFMMGRGGGGGGGGQPADNTTPYQPPTVKASADTRTNSVVVTGPAESLVVVDGIIKALESNGIEPQGVFVYALKNGTSADIAPVLNNIMGTSTATTGVGTRSNQPQGGNAANSALAGQNGLYGQVYVVANADTNSLLVMTMPKYFEQVKGIIKMLDRPIPQVLIRVLIAEITHEDTIDLGADFSFLNLTSRNRPGQLRRPVVQQRRRAAESRCGRPGLHDPQQGLQRHDPRPPDDRQSRRPLPALHPRQRQPEGQFPGRGPVSLRLRLARGRQRKRGHHGHLADAGDQPQRHAAHQPRRHRDDAHQSGD